RARCFMVMARCGAGAGRIETADGRVIEEPAPMGLTPDALRRAFGLPTPAASFPTAELLTSIWLNDVIGAAYEARGCGRSLTKAAVLRLHPAVVMLERVGQRVGPTRFVEAAVALSRALTWEEV